MDNLLKYFTYKEVVKNDDESEITLKNVVLNDDNVVFEYIFGIENDNFLNKFYNCTFPSVKLTNDIIEIHLNNDIFEELRDWYCPTSLVYPFVYKVDNDILTLTKVIYTPDTHVFQNLLKFPYYTVKEIKCEECFCFKNGFCTEEYHGDNMRSTQGYDYYHCTQFVLYNCTFPKKVYDKVYICSECSLLMVENQIYSLYMDAERISTTKPEYEYKPKTLYQHIFEGDEPGYYSGGGGTCDELEKVGYKMGVNIMCDTPYYKKGDRIFDYLFNYQTGIATVGKYEIKLYLHLGYLLKEF